MRLKALAVTLVTFAFLLDSFALGLLNSGMVPLQHLYGGALLAYSLPLLRIVSFPMLALIYIGSLVDILLIGQIAAYLRSRGRPAKETSTSLS